MSVAPEPQGSIAPFVHFRNVSVGNVPLPIAGEVHGLAALQRQRRNAEFTGRASASAVPAVHFGSSTCSSPFENLPWV
jgi:hypothetical protein